MKEYLLEVTVQVDDDEVDTEAKSRAKEKEIRKVIEGPFSVALPATAQGGKEKQVSQFESLHDDMSPVRCNACGELLPGWAKEHHLTECSAAPSEFPLAALVDEIEDEHCTCGAGTDHRNQRTWEYCGIHARLDKLRAALAASREKGDGK